MSYGNQNIDYTLRTGLIAEADNYDEHSEVPQPKYARKRSGKALRKRGKKRHSSAHPGCGIGGRRNRHYDW